MTEKSDNKPKAVVTGATGFVGSHLVDHLLEEGYQVSCVVRKSSNLRWLEGKDVELHDCGLKDEQALETVFEGASYIFHIAGVIKAKKKSGFFDGNVGMTKHIFEAALKHKDQIKRIVITSSLAAAGPTVPGKPVKETDKLAPINAYGESKCQQEALVRSYQHQLPFTIIRPPAVYGPRDGEVLLFFKTIKKGIYTQIGSKPKTLSLVHVRDLVRGIRQAAESEQANQGIYFLGSKEEYDWDQLASLSSEILSKKPVKIRVPHFLVYIISALSQVGSFFSKSAPTLNLEKYGEIIAPSWTCSSEKAMKDFNYQPSISLENGLQETIRWYEENKWM